LAPTPAANNLFNVRDSVEKLNKTEAEQFHTITAQLLFLALRARPDLLTTVSLLCTRVKAPDVDDKGKLRRAIRYLRHTKGLYLTLEVTNLTSLHWWVDASYAVHHDMRSHTGGLLSLGKDAIMSTSSRQKLNTKSSTEAELVGVDDMMGKILWTRYFIEAQGYPLDPTTIYQDNESAILLEKNGQSSSSKRTRHLNVRYFFITDRVKHNEVKIQHCDTKDMLADFFTKPLQGKLFYKLRDAVLNHPEHDADSRHPILSYQSISWSMTTFQVTMAHRSALELARTLADSA
jgi:hypothetical protein